ncbi:ribbon-helix-helix protein, CopG family [bacterium]|nr:ribbon-helix-helix protein, CopG family [bacterium]
MKAISIHVPEQSLGRFRSLSRETGRPVAELIREAMDRYLESRGRGASIFDLAAHDSGQFSQRSFSRSQIWDEMRE